MEDHLSTDLGWRGVGGGGGMIQVYHIYRALYFYYYYISSTSDHQALDLEVGDPALECIPRNCWGLWIERVVLNTAV